MKTAVDPSVLLDVLGGSGTFAIPSREALKSVYEQGALVVCDVVWAETRAHFPSLNRFHQAMKTLQIQFLPILPETAELAGELWALYHQQGGKRERVLADFLIGAHAVKQADRLLARDRGFYRSYFSKLKLLDPSHH